MFGVGYTSFCSWLRWTSNPSKENWKKMSHIMSQVNKGDTDPATDPLRATPPGIETPKTPEQKRHFVRVAFRVETLSDVLDKARQFGEIVVGENDDLFTVKKL